MLINVLLEILRNVSSCWLGGAGNEDYLHKAICQNLGLCFFVCQVSLAGSMMVVSRWLCLLLAPSGQDDLPRPWASKLNPAHSERYKLRGICCEGFSAGI